MLELLAIVILIAIAVEDFRHRLIHWWLLALLGVALFVASSLSLGIEQAVVRFGVNLAYVTGLLLVIVGYLAAKSGSVRNILDHKIGWGDVLFLVAVSTSMSFQGYVLWLLVAALMGIVVGVLMQWIWNKNDIPWAGVMAVLMIALLVADVGTGMNLKEFELSSMLP